MGFERGIAPFETSAFETRKYTYSYVTLHFRRRNVVVGGGTCRKSFLKTYSNKTTTTTMMMTWQREREKEWERQIEEWMTGNRQFYFTWSQPR